MRVTFYEPGAPTQEWLSELRALLPGAMVEQWVAGAAPADYAVVWAPPQQLIDEQIGLRALFNIGAGVDRLLQLRLPPSLKIVRLDDAGMGVQMAEYVCHTLIRHFREFDVYAGQGTESRWKQNPPRTRAEFPVGIMGLGVLGDKVAQAVRHFGFPLVGWSRTPRQVDGMRSFAGQAQFEDFLAATRVLVCLFR